MAHHKSAIKRIKQNAKKNARNRHVSSTLKTYIKKVRAAVEAKDEVAAAEALKAAIPVIDAMASKGVIHKSNASRNVSRLTRLVNAMNLRQPRLNFHMK